MTWVFLFHHPALHLDVHLVLAQGLVGAFQMIPDSQRAGTGGRVVLDPALDHILGGAGDIA